MTSAEEKRILESLLDAFRLWLELEDKHPSDVQEFVFHLHALQTLVAWRVARRADPLTWGSATSHPLTSKGHQR